MENNIDNIEEKMSKKCSLMSNNDKIDISVIKKEREKTLNKIHKCRIRNELINKKNNYFEELKTNYSEKVPEIIIQNLNITPNLKNENYINELLSSDKYDIIFDYIKEIYNNNNFNIDIVKYGLFYLNEKLLKNENEDILEKNDFINKFNFKEIIYLLLMYSKKENMKIGYDPVILKLTYQIIANYCYYCLNDIDVLFLIDDKFIELHLYFFETTSDKSVIKNILLMAYNISVENIKLSNKILTFKNNKFFNLLIDYINNYQSDNERVEIMLNLLKCYINIFNNEQIKNEKKKDNIIEMKDNTINCDWNIIENIYNISLFLIQNKKNMIFSDSIFLISSIIKITYKSQNFDLIDKIVKNNNTKIMLSFILEKNYEESSNNILFMTEIIKYFIKFYSNSLINNELKLNIINLINNLEQNLNENEKIIDIFIYLLSNKKISIKEKVKIKIIEAISSFLKNEQLYKNILENNKDDIFEIIFKYINSSNYEIRKKVMKIIENMTNKRDIILSDYLVKNKIFLYIKKAIDPTITYCNDEKLIICALKVINNLISIGEIFKKLNGFNPILVNFENIGGKELLDILLCNKSENVYNFSFKTIERYFN